jgi:hypothetical protein
MDVFKADAFSMMELSSAVDNMDFNPQMLGQMNLFQTSPVRNKRVFVDQRDDTLSLIPFTERGSPATQNNRYSRKAINFEVPRIAVQDTVWAAEIAGLREFGTEDELMTVAVEVNNRLQKMRQAVEYTEEYLRLAAIQGLVLDPADGSTLYNYFTEFGISQPAAVSFELDQTGTDVAGVCREVTRDIKRASKGSWIEGQSRVHALVGDSFFDALISHPNVEKFWINYQAAAEMRGIDAFSTFEHAGIVFHNYHGSDDNSEIAVADAEAKFFVVGGDGIFVKAQAPADEFAPFVNTPGQAVYAVQELDAAFQATPRFSKFHVHSYPLYMCQKPGTLRRGTLT